DRMAGADGEYGGVTGLVHEVTLDLDLRVPRLAPVVEAAPPAHAGRILVVAIDHPAWTVVVRDGLAALLAAVDEHVHVGLGIVADRRALAVRHRITQVVREQLWVAKQLLLVVAGLGGAGRCVLCIGGWTGFDETN